jgi:ribosome biogenesis protein MAK21
LSGEVIKYPGDPLQDFSLPRFLDRFVFKNPKKNIKEEVVRNSKFSRKKAYVPSGIRSLRVDSASYLNEDESKIPVDELFLYRLVLSC